MSALAGAVVVSVMLSVFLTALGGGREEHNTVLGAMYAVTLVLAFVLAVLVLV